MATTHGGLTFEEFLALPEEEPALEFEDGVITQKTSPRGQRSVLQGTLVSLINRVAVPATSAMAFPELRTSFTRRSYVPDVAVYRWDRIPTTESGKVANDFVEPPDVAIEIVSPGQGANSLMRRCLWFVAHGVRFALLVDARDESAILFPIGQMPKSLRESDRIDLAEVLPGFAPTVREVFDSLRIK